MKLAHDNLLDTFSLRLLAVAVLCALIWAHPAAAQTASTFRIANGTSGENPAVLWVGVEQGFYRKHGLNVEVIYMRVGSLAASALVSGDVNAVLTSSNAVLNLAAGGLDVVIIGALFQRPEGDFMARPEFKRAGGSQRQIGRDPKYRRRRLGEQYAGFGLPRPRPGP